MRVSRGKPPSQRSPLTDSVGAAPASCAASSLKEVAIMTSWLRLFAITVAFPGLLVAIPNNDEASAASFTGLGHLPGDFYGVCAYGASRCSFATAVSADGKVAVGLSTSAAGEQAFRWESGVMTGLGDLPGGDFSSAAYGVSADGSVVVGRGVPSFRVSGGT